VSFNPSKDSFTSLTTKIFDWVSQKGKQSWQKPQLLNNWLVTNTYIDDNLINDSQIDDSLIDDNLKPEIAVKPKWWSWLTILSLDAPTVAVLWQILFASSFDLVIKPIHAILLFAAVWLIYVFDRCFDGFVIAKALTARHDFYKRHFKRVAILAGIVVCSALVIAIMWLEPPIFLHGIILSGVVLLYLANLHLPKKPFLLIPKELQIGLVFAAGATITFWSQLDSLTVIENILFLSATLCFAMLCFLNCSLIGLWEKSVDVLHQQPSLARTTMDTDMAIEQLSFLFQSSLVTLMFITIFLPLSMSLKIAFVLSSLGLWALQYTQAKTSIDLRRVLADVVLMSPLVVLLLQ